MIRFLQTPGPIKKIVLGGLLTVVCVLMAITLIPGFGKNGVSDDNALKAGVFMAIEAKFGSNKPTPLRIGYLNSIRAEGDFAFVVSDRNIHWFEAFLESFDLSTAAAIKAEKVPDEHGITMLNAIHELSNKLLDTAGPHATVLAVPEAPSAGA